jgi:hypothetical protein
VGGRVSHESGREKESKGNRETHFGLLDLDEERADERAGNGALEGGLILQRHDPTIISYGTLKEILKGDQGTDLDVALVQSHDVAQVSLANSHGKLVELLGSVVPLVLG